MNRNEVREVGTESAQGEKEMESERNWAEERENLDRAF